MTKVSHALKIKEYNITISTFKNKMLKIFYILESK